MQLNPLPDLSGGRGHTDLPQKAGAELRVSDGACPTGKHLLSDDCASKAERWEPGLPFRTLQCCYRQTRPL